MQGADPGRCLGLLAVVTMAASITPAPLDAQRLLGVSVFEENDTFTDSDSSYTQGVRLGLQLRLPDFTNDWQWLTRCTSLKEPARDPCGLLTVGFGQLIFTPDSINSSERRPLGRPYAGFLFVAPGAQLVQRTAGVFDRPIDVSVGMEVPIGLTGPGSLAREAQTLFHWGPAHGALRPKGWDHQIAGAFIVNPRIRARARLAEICMHGFDPRKPCTEPSSVRIVDLIPLGEGAFGNLQKYAQIGFTARAGWNLPSDFGPEIVPLSRRLGGDNIRGFLANLTLGVHYAAQTKRVFYNRFIEGGGGDEDGLRTWSLIEPETVVGEEIRGFFFGYGTYLVALQWVRRDREFHVPALSADQPRLRFFNLTVSKAIGRSDSDK